MTDLDNGASWTRHDAITTTNRGSASSDVAGSVVQNDDGSITYQKNGTIANQDGDSVTRSKTVDLVQEMNEPETKTGRDRFLARTMLPSQMRAERRELHSLNANPLGGAMKVGGVTTSKLG